MLLQKYRPEQRDTKKWHGIDDEHQQWAYQKIKLPPPSTSLTIKKESNALLAEHKGNSQKLLSTIKSNLSKQSVPFNGNSKVPAWMLSNSSKQNRALASSFYACAMEMSREQNK